MSVKIRMTRMGRRHRPFFRINVIDSRSPRDGRVLEKLGHYDPLVKEADKQLVLNTERAMHWLSLGAIPSDTVSDMLVKLGVKHKYAEERLKKSERARAIAKKKGKPFDKAQRAEVQKRLDTEKAAADAAAKEAEEAAKAAAEAAKAKADAEAAKAKADEEAAEAGSGE
ncbi:MAG: 30S ribosomal protein S16 [Phycisphaeraceae bacterium]|nr:30S ribosomal protein S16 [Phycisphaeraceae bacterium]